MSTAYQIAPRPLYRKGRPDRDMFYVRFVRGHVCCVCESSRRVEAAHTGPHGMGQKSNDSTAIPLCYKHHQAGTDSLHALGPVAFETAHGISIEVVRAELNREYDQLMEKGKR